MQLATTLPLFPARMLGSTKPHEQLLKAACNELKPYFLEAGKQSYNILFGRKLVFGDPEQLAAIRLQERIYLGIEAVPGKLEYEKEYNPILRKYIRFDYQDLNCISCGHAILFSFGHAKIHVTEKENCEWCDAAYLVDCKTKKVYYRPSTDC